MVSTMQSSPLKFGKRFNRYCDATGHGWRRGEKQVWSVVERYPAMRLLRLFDDADAYDQKRNQTLSLLRLHEGPETWLEELQNQVRVGRRDREVRGRQGSPRCPRRGVGRRGGRTSQGPVRTRTGDTCYRAGPAHERVGVLERSHPNCRSPDQTGFPNSTSLKQLADWHESLRHAEQRLAIATAKLTTLESKSLHLAMW